MNAAKDFEAQVLPHLPKLRRRAQVFARGPAAEDLVQDTLLRAWTAWGRYKVNDVWGWLWLTMRNVFLDRRNSTRRWAEIAKAHSSDIARIRATPPQAPDAGITAGLEDHVLAAVQQLPKAQRTAIEMHLMGIDVDTAAESLQIGRKSALVSCRKARQRLRLTVAGG